MKNRLAALQLKLDGAIKSYREHTGTDAPTETVALEAYNAKTNQLKAAMDAASQAVQSERTAIEAERGLDGLAISSNANISGGAPAIEKDGMRGFRSSGDFMIAVHRASIKGGSVDTRLGRFEAAAPTTYGNEATGADGGYLVPPDIAKTIYAHSLQEGSFLPLTDQIPITGNTITFPKDETTPWGTNGIRVYWQGEAAAASQAKPVTGEQTLKLRKLIGLVPMTDELIADALAGSAYVNKKLGTSMAWKTNVAIVEGAGGSTPLGYRTSGAIITQAAEGGQTATTFNATNAAKMLSRLLPSSLASKSTRWLINNDVLPQLVGMTIGNQPIWTAPNQGMQDAPMGYLLGRPIVITQACKTLGALGDVQLVDFAQYQTISKGPEYAESMHLFFDADTMAFRLVFRVDGAPWISAPVTPANGANSLSAFVQLAAR
jgi:HK97 family phage major capsid protein